MGNNLLHIFRNTPFGRETILQSMYFCQTLGISLHIYIPSEKKFLLYFEHAAIQVDLDNSYLQDQSTAQDHVRQLLSEFQVQAHLLQPKGYSASNLPDISTAFGFMTSPRIISELSSKIGLGHIGAKVRAILRAAPFPVLIPSHVFKPWKSITVMFGGSINGVKALQLGLKISQISKLPLDIFTQSEQGAGKKEYEKIIRERNLEGAVTSYLRNWYFYDRGDMSANLYQVPHDALVIMGLFGHGLIKDIVFGSTTELVQSLLPNSLLLVGPEFKKHPWYQA